MSDTYFCANCGYVSVPFPGAICRPCQEEIDSRYGPRSAAVIPHPVICTSPDAARQFERETGLALIVADGRPRIVRDMRGGVA